MPKTFEEVKHAVELCGCRTECKRCPYVELGSEWNRWACSMHLMWDVLYWFDELEDWRSKWRGEA